jgi:putative transposase
VIRGSTAGTADHRFTDPQGGEHGGAVLDGRALRVSKIGRLPIRVHRPLEGRPQIVTSSKEADGWHAGLSCAEVPAEPLPLTCQETGMDVGLKVFLGTADGEIVEHPRRYRKAEKPRANAQRRVSRRKKGGQRRKKAVKLLARAQPQVPRQRRDFHQKTALALVREYDTIYLEDLQARNLSRRPQATLDGNGGDLHHGAAQKAGLNQSSNDAGWDAFRRLLTCKAEWAGKRVEAVPPA